MSIKDLVVIEEAFFLEKSSNDGLAGAVSFVGSLSKHPHEDKKFILVLDPVSEHTEFIEFLREDVVFIEDHSRVVATNGQIITLKKVWMQEGAIALKLSPFVIAKTRYSF